MLSSVTLTLVMSSAIIQNAADQSVITPNAIALNVVAPRTGNITIKLAFHFCNGIGATIKIK